ncbi:MAG: branched-chain amino acid ABC transporter permease [Candidatus Bathyarchaeota archaeon]|nr:branched-chain amino acid ABC transporter permease [Candidatus Bathyarchaeota archaeon]
MSLELLAQTIINGLFIGFLFGLAGLGLTIIFGVMRIINFATGAMIMLGAYVAFWTYTYWPYSVIPGIIVSIGVGFLFGVFVYQVLVRRLIGKPMLTTLLVLFGLAAILENSMLNLWSPNPRSIPVDFPTFSYGLIAISMSRVFVSVMAVITTLSVLAVFKYTTFGKTIRAVMQDKIAATLMGVDVNRVYTLGFALGSTLTFLAGSLLAMVYPFEPFGGLPYALMAFVVVVLGTLGNPVGCLIAGLIIGLVHSFVGSYWTLNMSPAVAYLIMIITFLLRPQGLMGRKED